MDVQLDPIVVSPIPDGFRVRIQGAVYADVADLVRELEAVVTAKPKLVEVDLGEATFLSSSAVGILVGLQNKVGRNGGHMRIVAVRRPVLSTLRFARLDQFFTIDPEAVVDEK